jgi:hypothetical protein
VTSSETRFLQRLIIFLVIAAMCPLGAFVYRFALSVAPESVPSPDPIFTLVPVSVDLGLATPAPTSVVVVVPNGWTEYALPEHGFALSVPTRWQRLAVKPQELEAALEVIRDSNPELANVLGVNSRTLMQNGVRFWAFDLNADPRAPDFVTNVTVTRQQLPSAISFDNFVAINLNQLNALSSRNSEIVHERTSIAGQPSERVRYLLNVSSEDSAPLTTAITQYLVMSEKSAFVLTYATRTDLVERYQAVFDQSAQSLRFMGQ